MKAIYTSDGSEQVVIKGKGLHTEVAWVNAGDGHRNPGELRCEVSDTGNGFIAYYPGNRPTQQDYYVCLDYAQARDLVLGLSMFKKELGFKDD